MVTVLSERKRNGVLFLDPRKRDKIRNEMKKAEEFLQAAELLHKNGLYNPCVTIAYYSAVHATIAAYLTAGIQQKEALVHFTSVLNKLNSKVDPLVSRLKEAREEWMVNTSLDYAESEALLRIYQAREFVLEVKDFLRRIIKF